MKDKNAKKKNFPRIFVQIANYRDSDFDNTVDDLLKKAAHPECIRLGVCWQTLEGDPPIKRRKNMRVVKVDALKSRGVCWARSQTQKLWQGEPFTLQLDAHNRFELHWDETLLEMWKMCRNKKALITAHAHPYRNLKNLKKWICGTSVVRGNIIPGILNTQIKKLYSISSPPAEPFKGAFISAGYLFGPSKIIKDVPYDPYIYFFGEELSLAARLWTHGYDIYHPNKICIYHDWERKGQRRRQTSTDFKIKKRLFNRIGFARVRHLLGYKKSTNPEVLQDLELYGLGKKRSLCEYEKWSGIDFGKKQFFKIKYFTSDADRKKATRFKF